MNAVVLLGNLWRFFTSFRRSGTSTLIGKIAKENDVFVLIVDRAQRRSDMYNELDGNKFLILDDIIANKYEGLKPKPILVDNYTMLKIAEICLKRMEQDAAVINRNEDFIKDVSELFKTHLGEGARSTTVTTQKP